MKAKDAAAGGVGFEQIGETGLDACGLIKEWERPPRGREGFRDALTIFLCLRFEAGKRRAFLFGLNDTHGLPIREKEVVGLTEAVGQRESADGNAGAGVDVSVGPILDEPSGGNEHAVDRLPCLFFRCQSGPKALGHQFMTPRLLTSCHS